MVVFHPGFSPRRRGLAPAKGRLRRRMQLALLPPAAALLVLPLLLVGQAGADNNANASLPLPQLKAASLPQPTGQLQPASLQQPAAQSQPGGLPQVSGQPSNRMPQLKTSRRIPLAEPLPAVDSPPPTALQPLVQGVSKALESFAGLSSTGYTQPPARPGQIPVPMPLIRPQQVTVPGGLRPLSDITTDIAPPGGPLPKDRSDVLVVGTTNPMFYARSANLVRYQWEAPVVCHRPLYFQDVPLEHFGQSCCPYLQPAISAAKFLGNVLILPYRVALIRLAARRTTCGPIRAPAHRSPACARACRCGSSRCWFKWGS